MVIYLRRASAADVERIRANPTSLEHFVFEQGEHRIDLIGFDKAWHALHFMLTGQAYGRDHPLGIIADETPTEGTDENGFGGFSVIEPSRLAIFAEKLSEVTDEALAARFDPQAMLAADIYIADAFVEDDPVEAVEYILQGLPDLRQFVTSCSERGDGALRILS